MTSTNYCVWCGVLLLVGFLLCLVPGLCACGRHGTCLGHRKGLQYLLLALFDVEANFTIVKAYQLVALCSRFLPSCIALSSLATGERGSSRWGLMAATTNALPAVT